MSLVVFVAAVVLGAAIWKPWEDGGIPAREAAAPPAVATGALLPATTSGPAAAAAPVRSRSTGPFIAGLDLAIMGTADPHRGWGVAVAYVPRNQIDAVIRRNDGAITPVVSWELIEPGRRPPGPTLDHPNVVNVAIAATWPIGTEPLAIRLWSRPPAGTNPSARPAPSDAAARAIELGAPLAARIAAAASEAPPAVIESGGFFLLSATAREDPSGWIGNGWPAGAYAFEVVTEGGIRTILPFILASDGS